MRVSKRTHPDIIRLLKQQNAPAQHTNPCADVLNAVNAFDALGDLEKRPPSGIHIYGPRAIADGSTVLVWYRKRGYNSYKTITVFGLWGITIGDTATLIIGTRALRYAMPFYNPESYHYRIREDFTRFYGDDVPPPDAPIWQTNYLPEHRIDIRLTINTVINKWRDQF